MISLEIEHQNNQTQIYTTDDVRSLVSALFVMVTCFSTCFLFNTAVEFPLQMPVLKREIKSKCYSVESCYLAEMLSSMLVVVFSPIVFVPIVYFMAGYSSDIFKVFDCYFIFVFVLFACTGTTAKTF